MNGVRWAGVGWGRGVCGGVWSDGVGGVGWRVKWCGVVQVREETGIAK